MTEDSSTPLHKACAGSKPGHLVAVQLLLDGGADVHALNKWRETPLLTAANHGQAGAVEALLKSGADPCKCTDTGWSPLSIAAYKGHDDVVRLLLEEGAPTEEADPTLSALLQAATKGLPGTVELLLRHGADHTVTTKKGDTALSILVEQNLIDAAVEMVTEYKASVPRCSRDRKKVQRARLLINLRVKQQQREGTLSVGDDDESDFEDSADEAKSAQHDESNGGSPLQVDDEPNTQPKKKKGKKKGGKMSAEEQAKAAEEALLLELEEEDAKARKEEQDANKKSAKKRKKKEQQRQQKLKEEQKRREKEERELQEKERKQKEKEEKLRKEREEKARIQREKEMKEAAEREKAAAARRKEREEKERRQQERLQQQQQKKAAAAAAAAPSPPITAASNSTAASQEKRGKQTKPKGGKKQPQAHTQVPGGTNRNAPEIPVPKPAAFNSAVSAPIPAISAAVAAPLTSSKSQVVGQTKNRGWETKNSPSVVANPSELRQTPPSSIPPDRRGLNTTPQANPIGRQIPSPAANVHTPTRTKPIGGANNNAGDGVVDFLGFDTNRPPPKVADNPFATASIGQLPGMLTPQQQKSIQEVNSFASLSAPGKMKNGLAPRRIPVNVMELPAVAVYRLEKVGELLQRCALARSQSPSSDPLGVVGEDTIKKVLYRWMVRAAHEQQAFLDIIIPSWIDFEQLTTFFQRQFIAESRKGMKQSGRGAAMVSMESLKEAGTAMAVLCQALSKDIDDYRRRVEEQLPPDWSDMTVGVIASDVMKNGGGSMILIDWANRSQVYLTASTFTRLRDRYVGPHERLLTSFFVAKVRYDTKRLIVADSAMDFRLLRNTQSCLAMEAGVNAEFWSDPFSALSSSIFSGQFADVDALFGGLKPFGKEDGVEDFLARHGGSVSLLAPLDNLVASRYLHRILDLLDSSDGDRIPLSFAVFLRSECFHDQNEAPSAKDLHLLDSRLGDRAGFYLRHAVSLPAGQHSFQVGEGDAVEVSWTGSLLVLLQNKAGAHRFDVKDSGIGKIVHSTGTNNGQASDDRQVLTAPISSFTGSFGAPTEAPNNHPPTGYFVDTMAPISPMHPQTMPQTMAPTDFGPIGGTAISKAFGAPAANPAQPSSARRPGGHRGRLFDLVDDGEEDNLNDVDVVSGMLNNLDLYNIPQSDVDIDAIALYGIGGPPPAGSLPPGNSRGRFG